MMAASKAEVVSASKRDSVSESKTTNTSNTTVVSLLNRLKVANIATTAVTVKPQQRVAKFPWEQLDM